MSLEVVGFLDIHFDTPVAQPPSDDPLNRPPTPQGYTSYLWHPAWADEPDVPFQQQQQPTIEPRPLSKEDQRTAMARHHLAAAIEKRRQKSHARARALSRSVAVTLDFEVRASKQRTRGACPFPRSDDDEENSDSEDEDSDLSPMHTKACCAWTLVEWLEEAPLLSLDAHPEFCATLVRLLSVEMVAYMAPQAAARDATAALKSKRLGRIDDSQRASYVSFSVSSPLAGRGFDTYTVSRSALACAVFRFFSGRRKQQIVAADECFMYNLRSLAALPDDMVHALILYIQVGNLTRARVHAFCANAWPELPQVEIDLFCSLACSPLSLVINLPRYTRASRARADAKETPIDVELRKRPPIMLADEFNADDPEIETMWDPTQEALYNGERIRSPLTACSSDQRLYAVMRYRADTGYRLAPTRMHPYAFSMVLYALCNWLIEMEFESLDEFYSARSLYELIRRRLMMDGPAQPSTSASRARANAAVESIVRSLFRFVYTKQSLIARLELSEFERLVIDTMREGSRTLANPWSVLMLHWRNANRLGVSIVSCLSSTFFERLPPLAAGVSSLQVVIPSMVAALKESGTGLPAWLLRLEDYIRTRRNPGVISVWDATFAVLVFDVTPHTNVISLWTSFAKLEERWHLFSVLPMLVDAQLEMSGTTPFQSQSDFSDAQTYTVRQNVQLFSSRRYVFCIMYRKHAEAVQRGFVPYASVSNTLTSLVTPMPVYPLITQSYMSSSDELTRQMTLFTFWRFLSKYRPAPARASAKSERPLSQAIPQHGLVLHERDSVLWSRTFHRCLSWITDANALWDLLVQPIQRFKDDAESLPTHVANHIGGGENSSAHSLSSRNASGKNSERFQGYNKRSHGNFQNALIAYLDIRSAHYILYDSMELMRRLMMNDVDNTARKDYPGAYALLGYMCDHSRELNALTEDEDIQWVSVPADFFEWPDNSSFSDACYPSWLALYCVLGDATSFCSDAPDQRGEIFMSFSLMRNIYLGEARDTGSARFFEPAQVHANYDRHVRELPLNEQSRFLNERKYAFASPTANDVRGFQILDKLGAMVEELYYRPVDVLNGQAANRRKRPREPSLAAVASSSIILPVVSSPAPVSPADSSVTPILAPSTPVRMSARLESISKRPREEGDEPPLPLPPVDVDDDFLFSFLPTREQLANMKAALPMPPRVSLPTTPQSKAIEASVWRTDPFEERLKKAAEKLGQMSVIEAEAEAAAVPVAQEPPSQPLVRQPSLNSGGTGPLVPRASERFRDLLSASAYLQRAPTQRAPADLPTCILERRVLTQAESFVHFQSEFVFTPASGLREVSPGSRRAYMLPSQACVLPFVGASVDFLECVLCRPVLYVCGEQQSATFKPVYDDVPPEQRAAHRDRLPRVNELKFGIDSTTTMSATDAADVTERRRVLEFVAARASARGID